jgi:ribosome-binding factor A
VDEIRRRRIEEQLREVIAELILGGQVKDPRVGPFVSVTRVEAARDLSAAKIYVSVFPGTAPAGAVAPVGAPPLEGGPAVDSGERALGLAVEGLQNAAGFIQAQLAKRMKTRLTPRLSFIADKGIKEGFELNERMKGLFS